jgi:hypothetical protein
MGESLTELEWVRYGAMRLTHPTFDFKFTGYSILVFCESDQFGENFA